MHTFQFSYRFPSTCVWCYFTTCCLERVSSVEDHGRKQWTNTKWKFWSAWKKPNIKRNCKSLKKVPTHSSWPPYQVILWVPCNPNWEVDHHRLEKAVPQSHESAPTIKIAPTLYFQLSVPYRVKTYCNEQTPESKLWVVIAHGVWETQPQLLCIFK